MSGVVKMKSDDVLVGEYLALAMGCYDKNDARKKQTVEAFLKLIKWLLMQDNEYLEYSRALIVKELERRETSKYELPYR